MSRAERQQRGKRRRAHFRNAVFTKGAVQLTGGRVSRVRPGRDFIITEHRIAFPHLPDDLHGLSIAHFPDPHVGELLTPDHLPHIVDATNQLNADLIAVTGDFIDLSNKYLDHVIAAMKQLDAPLGAWFVLGNHDYLDDGEQVKQAFIDARLNLLLNDASQVRCCDRLIAVAGIDWASSRTSLRRHVRETVARMPNADLSILLAHHPHAFDAAHRCGIDLTLAGHTHGGQVLLSTVRGKKGSIGPANLGFRYTRGLYSRGDARLFVSSGVGSWFPLRFRCPAEITRLVLHCEHHED